MPSTRDIRRRIKSVKNTSQITKAMQMVAASKMRTAQESAYRGRPYAEGMNKVLSSLSRRAEDIKHPLWGEATDSEKPCYLIISTDKGLCGGLNTNLFREVLKAPESAQFVTIGRRGRQLIAKTGRNLLADFPLVEKPTFQQSKSISKFLIDKFTSGEFDSVSIFYNEFVNTLVQKPTQVPVLPIQQLSEFKAGIGNEKEASAQEAKKDATADLDYIYEPSATEVRDELFPAYVHFQIYQMLLEAQASEHSARMVAMKNATENAKNLVDDLTLEYNKARQTAITNEILEISAAQLAME
ncbi:MAG: ATP synthase F1 subunit gamma [Verrucomicrobiota bacterium]